MWVGSSPIGSLRYRYAEPLSEFVSTFSSGEGPFAAEVDRYFNSAKWALTLGTTVFQFGYGTSPDVALAALRLVERQQIILVLGIAESWHGRSDPQDPSMRVVDVIIETIADIARGDGADRLLLRVRAENSRAINAYERNGFSIAGSLEGGRTLEMSRRA